MTLSEQASRGAQPGSGPQGFVSFAATWGLFLGLGIGVLTIIDIAGGFYGHAWWLKLLGWVVPILIIALAMVRYRQSLGNAITYGRAFKMGLLASVFASVVELVIFILMMFVIVPDAYDGMLALVQEELQSKLGNTEQLEMAYSMALRFTTPFILSLSAFFGALFNGLVVSLLVAIFVKNKKS